MGLFHCGYDFFYHSQQSFCPNRIFFVVRLPVALAFTAQDQFLDSQVALRGGAACPKGCAVVFKVKNPNGRRFTFFLLCDQCSLHWGNNA